MRKTLMFALCGAIWFVAPTLGNSAELLSGGQGAPGAGIFFDMPTSVRMLDELEQCRIIKEEKEVLLTLDRNHEELERLLRERIEILEKNQADLERLNETALKNAEMARKATGGTWYERLFNAGKWIGLGILVGFSFGISN